MKRHILSIVLILTLCFSLAAFADFSDVESGSWYEDSLERTTESGLLSGISDSLFAPDDYCTVSQMIAIAARINSSYTGRLISVEGENWYDGYVAYAKENGIIYDGLFSDYNGYITRAETAYIIRRAIPDGYLSAINKVVGIPDADTGSAYYDCAITLYNAGILTGFDEYGAFRPSSFLKRSHACVMIDRIINPESRVSQSFEIYSSGESYYLIDDFIMTSSVRGAVSIGSGWLVDYSGSGSINETGSFSNALSDTRKDAHMSAARAIYPQYSGKLTLEAVFTLGTGSDGARLFFTDDKGENVIEMYSYDGYFHVSGESDTRTSLLSATKTYRIKMLIDLDKKTAVIYSGTENLGEFALNPDFSEIARLNFATTDEARMTLTINNVHLYKNYFVNDVFRIESAGDAPIGYTSDGDVTVQKINSNASNTGDVMSVRINAAANQDSNVHKDFEKTDGKIRFESYILLPNGDDGAYVSLNCDKNSVIKIETRDGKLWCGDIMLRAFTANVWQMLHIEADTQSQTALIRIDGKTVAENIPFAVKVPYFDSLDIGIKPQDSTVMWFDDVEVTRIFDYADYVPEPVPLESDYYLSMSICNLWRNGSHYGWDYISPYDDLTPYLGYYDEGIPEEMDWEIKFLADHGFSSYHMCWYAPANPATDPIKKPRMVDALHDGYFNAKYSDYLDFSIMWENNGYTTSDIDAFKKNVWQFWVDWYFTDERYFKIDNKPYLTIYSYNSFHSMCGDTATEKELLTWMRSEIKKYGFDDIIIVFSTNGSSSSVDKTLSNIGADGITAYNWGSTVYDLEVNKKLVSSCNTTAANNGIDLLAVAGIGFNITGWKQTRTPLMSIPDFRELLSWFRDDYMTQYDSDSWKSKYIQFATWNEFGEGHYMFPSNVNGFGYLDAIAETFGKTKAYDTEKNVVPDDTQKARLSHLYPGTYMPLRRELYVTPEMKIPEIKVWEIDYTNPLPSSTIAYSNISSFAYSASEKCYTGKTKSNDPIIWYKSSTYNSPIFEASTADVLHIGMYSDLPSTGGLYFITDKDGVYNETKDITFTVKGSEKFEDYYLDLASNASWQSFITGIRFDPTGASDATVKIAKFEFLQYSDEQKAFSFVFDGKEASMKTDEVREIGRYELYTAIKQESGLLTLTHLSYEWNRHTGILLLKAPNGTEFEFTVGSDIAKVNGKEVVLDRKIEKYDGMPVVPFIFILERSGIDYSYDYTHRKLCGYVVSTTTKKADISGGSGENCQSTDFYTSSDNVKLGLVKDEDNSENHYWKVTGSDGQVWSYLRTDVSFEKGTTYTADFDVKITGLANGEEIISPLSFYFNPRYYDANQLEITNKFDHAYLVCSLLPSDNWRHVSYTFTVGDEYESHPELFADQLSFFVNPLKTSSGYTGVDFCVDNVILRSNGKPFAIINGDAEGTETNVFFTSTTSQSISIVEDPENASNNVWLVKNNNTSSQSWSYIRQNTVFEEGYTYKIEFDVKVTTLSDGTIADDVSIVPNLRFYDTAQLNIATKYDHSISATHVAASDGWVHISATYTMPYTYDPDVHPAGFTSSQFTIYANPAKNAAGTSLGVNYMVDNIVISVPN